MSFFGQLMAGAASGAAGGYIQDRAEDEKLAYQQALQAEKHREKLELQQRDQEFRAELASMKNGGSSSSGGGGSSIGKGDFNLAALAYEAVKSNDLAQLQALEKMATMMGGDQARDHVRYSLGMGGEQQASPTEQDVMASMATDGQDYTPQAPSGGSRGQREAALGLQAFQRAFARGIGKTKDQAEGEEQENTNDLYTQVLGQSIKGGNSLIDAGRNAAMATQPAEFDKTARSNTMSAATERKADMAADTAEKNRVSQEIRTLESEINSLIKPPSFEADEDKAARLDRIAYLNTNVKLLRSGRESPAKQPSQWTATGSTSGKDPRALAEKYRALTAR